MNNDYIQSWLDNLTEAEVDMIMTWVLDSVSQHNEAMEQAKVTLDAATAHQWPKQA